MTMEKKEFKITIDAPKEKVWSSLWNDAPYGQWTSVFAEGSRAETDWNKGSKVLFLDGKNDGMVSTIAEKIPNEFMSFKHLGVVKDGVEDVSSEQTKDWAGALENYTLKTVNGKTELTVAMDITPEHMDYFMKTWPKALERVKEIAEKNSELISEF
jgi:Activator of Hsp90 ATPase homolog 1-like protein